MNGDDDSQKQSSDSTKSSSGDESEVVNIEIRDVEKPDWLTEMDVEILEILGHNLILTPSLIAENIDRSREGVSQRLNALQAGGLVEKIERGKYKISYEGLGYIGVTTTIEDSDSQS